MPATPEVAPKSSLRVAVDLSIALFTYLLIHQRGSLNSNFSFTIRVQIVVVGVGLVSRIISLRFGLL
jgi:hypothetical protein